ncbi:MAG: hypothetical protein EHM87_20105, partial [Burkholderiales bacterium]
MHTVKDLAKQAFALTQQLPGFDAVGTAALNKPKLKPGIDPIGNPPANLPKRPYPDMALPTHTAAPDNGQPLYPDPNDYPHNQLNDAPGMDIPNYVYHNKTRSFNPETNVSAPKRPTGLPRQADYSRFNPLQREVHNGLIPESGYSLGQEGNTNLWRPPLHAQALKGPTQVLRNPESPDVMDSKIHQHNNLMSNLVKHRQLEAMPKPSVPQFAMAPDAGQAPAPYQDRPIPANTVRPSSGQAPSPIQAIARQAANRSTEVAPDTEAAFRDFNSTPLPPRVNTGKIIEDRLQENLANASALGKQQVNDKIDTKLQRSAQLGRSLGGADYRQARTTGVIPPRGM